MLAQRLGHPPTATELAAFDSEALIAIFAEPPALHRFPKAMAGRVQEVCRVLVASYDGEAVNLWGDAADGKELVKRIGALPGFGKQKSQIFTALGFQEGDEGGREGLASSSSSSAGGSGFAKR